MIEKNTKDTRQYVTGTFPIPEGNGVYEECVKAHKALWDGICQGSEMRGWLYWPKEYYLSDEYKMLKGYLAEKIKGSSDAVVVVGIGGSYLTPQAIIHSEYGEFYNEIAVKKGLPKMYFAGCDLSPDKLNQILERVSEGDWSVIYISKSGGTMEPALAFRVLWKALCEKYGEEAACGRVYTVTDAEKGILKGLTNEHDWDSCVIPDDIGGRFSGLTAVGLLPIMVAGIDTDAILRGAIHAMHDCYGNPNNFAVHAAAWRLYNYLNGCKVEVFATNTPYFLFVSEWLKQLNGESEGKDNMGVFPTSVTIPTDLHSLGQYLQEGTRNLIFETFIKRKFKGDIEIPESDLRDNLDAYAGKKFTQACSAAMQGAYNAHTAGGNPCALIEVEESLEAMGALMYYCFHITSIVSVAMGVNPYNQPGVEFHKVEMKKSPEWDK